MRNGIFSSLRQILEKRVLPSLYPLFDSPKLDRELRSKIRETFKEFCLPPNTEPGKFITPCILLIVIHFVLNIPNHKKHLSLTLDVRVMYLSII